ncbi:MAG: RNA polymerase sigma factor [bacterium]|nr:RNA polymerase sigma factor [bacterium]
MKIGKIEEKLLLHKIKQNDKNAFVRAYDLYVDQLYRFIYFKVGNREEAEDLCSAVFLKTWHYILKDNLKDYKTLKALLYKISRNLIIDHYRKTKGRETVSLDDENGIKVADEKQSPHYDMEFKADLLVLESKLPELKDEYREIIILRFINELSIKEIAEVLDKSRGNVRILIYRSLNALKGLLSQDEKINLNT